MLEPLLIAAVVVAGVVGAAVGLLARRPSPDPPKPPERLHGANAAAESHDVERSNREVVEIHAEAADVASVDDPVERARMASKLNG